MGRKKARQGRQDGFQPWVDYKGYVPQPHHDIARVSADKLSPRQLWEHFISKRRPVIIEGFPKDPSWQAEQWKDLDSLAKLAGHVPVKVEPVHPELGHFGTAAKRVTMPFRKYIASLRQSAGNGQFYLTTQYEETDDEEEDGGESSDDEDEDVGSDSAGEIGRDRVPEKRSTRPEARALKRKRASSSGSHSAPSSQDDFGYTSDAPSSSSEASIVLDLPGSTSRLPATFRPPPLDPLLPRPTDALADDFPLQPELMGNLVLQQTNLWLGNSKQGKSSGLHHDFHDNLYALLAGRKRFVLFPPVAFDYLRPRGTVERVHQNGLIEYTPRGSLHVDHPLSNRLPLRSDGLPASEAARWRLLFRKSKVESASEAAAQSAGEAHIPKGRRKGKGRMSAEQEAWLEKFDESVQSVLKFLEMDEEEGAAEWADEMGSGDEAVFYPQGDEEDDSDEDISEESDSDDDLEGDFDDGMDGVPPGLREIMARAAQGDPNAARIIAQLMAEAQDDEQGDTSQEDDDDEDDDDDDVQEGDDDDDGHDDDPGLDSSDFEDDDYLTIPRRPGNLPGGLRRDDLDDDDDEYEDFDDLATGDLLLLGGEDGEFLDGADDHFDDYEESEEQLAAMNALRQEVALRMRQRGLEVDLPEALASAAASHPEGEPGTNPSSTTSSQEQAEDDSDAIRPDQSEELQAAIMAHLQAGGQLIVGDGSSSDGEEGRDSSSASDVGDESQSQSIDDEEDAASGLGADNSEHPNHHRRDLDTRPHAQLSDTGDQSDESDWGGDVDDAEAALAALDAQANALEAPSGRATMRPKVESDKEPLSFSLIDPATLHRHFGLTDHLSTTTRGNPANARGQHVGAATGPKPRKGCPAPLVADLRPGEMLYLPASWWHEVTSEASPSDAPDGNSIHMALNWWFHPPDNLTSAVKRPKNKSGAHGSGTGGSAAAAAAHNEPDPFDEPYRDIEVWSQIRAKVQSELQRKRLAARAWKRRNSIASQASYDVDHDGSSTFSAFSSSSPPSSGASSPSREAQASTANGVAASSGGRRRRPDAGAPSRDDAERVRSGSQSHSAGDGRTHKKVRQRTR
ncbi:unnamed protein product [Parajaminaea phylloscopi]